MDEKNGKMIQAKAELNSAEDKERKENGRKNAPEMQIIATNGDKYIAKMHNDYFISWPVRV